HASLAAQPALARFMDEGHFASHIRRMRRLYGARQEYLLAAAERHLGGLLRLAPDDAGMHLLAMLEPALAERMGDAEAARLASKAGVSAVALSTYTTNVVVKPGLVLGYAAVDENESEAATQRLAQALS
ncbi:MAG: PLP-dependent aminotransferase family protein, partial [Rhodospirillaceae bacterium]|nr:PLP-dependent aminotransferase family protein [Rhodospirillaceae bacterium]